MYTKSIFGVVFATLATFAVASPPACLLAAINEQKTDAVEVAKICKDNAKDVQEMLVKVCKTDAQDALNYFADTCKTNGVTVEPFVIPTTTASTAAPTGTNTKTAGLSTVTTTGTAPNPTATNTPGAGGNGSGGQTTTPNSASMKVPSLAAAALLAAGIVFAV